MPYKLMIVMIISSLCLSGCGKKGALYLPAKAGQQKQAAAPESTSNLTKPDQKAGQSKESIQSEVHTSEKSSAEEKRAEPAQSPKQFQANDGNSHPA